MEKRASLPLKLDTWDSHFFNTAIARAQLSGRVKDPRLSEKLSALKGLAKKKRIAFLVIKVVNPTSFYERNIVSQGFRKFGESVDLVLRRPRAMCAEAHGGWRILPFRVKYKNGVRTIAKDAFRLSYLYRCGFAKTGIVDCYHSFWAENLSKDRNSRMFVAQKGGRIVGFVGMNVDTREKQGRIRLIAVDKRFRGYGIGSSLIRECVTRAGEERLGSIYVKTQKNNIRALAVYKKMGFKEVACDQVFCKKIL